MRLYCVRCLHATIPLNINGTQAYACPLCGAVYVHRENNIYSFAADLQGSQGVKELLNQTDPIDAFQEVEQPESIFLIRLNDRGISFTEADGGMWKLKARETIKAFLEEKLAKEAKEGSVIIAL